MNSITVNTPIGWLKIEGTEEQITAITYMDHWQENCGQLTQPLENAAKQLCEYFDGERKVFDLPLKFEGESFAVRVWKTLAAQPYGTTVTYGQLAALCGSPKAARAVGTAMRKNPFVIVVPCHRVLPQGKGLGNYSAGGPANKEWLLTFEKQNSLTAFL